MSKHCWLLWLVPAAFWAVSMCWLTGYQNGYEQGHSAGWETARHAFTPQFSQSSSPDRDVRFSANRTALIEDPASQPRLVQ